MHAVRVNMVARSNQSEAIATELARQAGWLDQVEKAASRFRILSTLPYGKAPFWNRVVTTVPTKPNFLTPLTRKAGIPDLFVIFRLLARAHRHQVVLLAGGERADLVYAALAGLCLWIRTPHVIVDAHWQKAGGLGGRLQRVLLSLAARVIVQVQPHSTDEIEIYEREFGIPRAKLRAIPWSTSLIGYQLPPCSRDEGYILSGGHSFRDYPVFIKAAGELGLRVKLGISAQEVGPNLRALVARYPSISLHSDWSNDAYFKQMAGCTVYAMPIQQGLTRSTADQTILNAMHLGKVVVATDSIGSRIYIKHGENGFLVKEPTEANWKAVLQQAMSLSDPQYDAIGDQARFDAQVQFNEFARLGRTLDNVLEILDPGHRASWAVR
jgi:glycosyltransferase involved in cell wall biosynthesis